MGIYNPYAGLISENCKWYKCNFHVHDNTYDNKKFATLDPVFEQYKACNYDIITISSQTEYEDNSVIAEKYGMHTIAGEEYAEVDGFLLIGINEFISGSPQKAIDKCLEQNGFAVACHPHMSKVLAAWMPGKFITPELIESVTGIVGIEIVNGAIGRMHMHEYGTTLGRAVATDVWDDLLMKDKKLWGFGSDDSHMNTEIDRAWTCIYSKSTEIGDIKEAVESGCLYTSTGLFLNKFELSGKQIIIEANFPYEKEEIDYKLIVDGKLKERVSGVSAVLDIPQFEHFARIEAVAPDGSSLWMQPLLKDTVL